MKSGIYTLTLFLSFIFTGCGDKDIKDMSCERIDDMTDFTDDECFAETLVGICNGWLCKNEDRTEELTRTFEDCEALDCSTVTCVNPTETFINVRPNSERFGQFLITTEQEVEFNCLTGFP